MEYYRDFYLYHLSLLRLTESYPIIDVVSPVAISGWYDCTSQDFIQHLKGNFLFSSTPGSIANSKCGGLTDMSALVITDITVPFGAGYTRHYAMRVAALYLGLDLSLLHKRYDTFGNKWAASRNNRISISPVSSRAGGDPDQLSSWNFKFPPFRSCNHSYYHIINYKQLPASQHQHAHSLTKDIFLDRDPHDWRGSAAADSELHRVSKKKLYTCANGKGPMWKSFGPKFWITKDECFEMCEWTPECVGVDYSSSDMYCSMYPTVEKARFGEGSSSYEFCFRK
jgi:hypothetical protein